MSSRAVRRALVTGANGFVGTAVCRHLIARGWTLRGSVRRSAAVLPEGVERLVSGPIDGTTDWTAGLEGVDAVVHCAARAHILREEAADPLVAFRRVNVEASANLARQAAAAGVARIVFISSIGAMLAETGPDTASPYQTSKREAEIALAAATGGTATELVVLRPPLIYGPGAPGNIRRLESLIAKGLPLPLASIHNRRSLLYIGNLTEAVQAALTVEKVPEAPLALSDGTDLSTPDLVRRIAGASGRKARLMPFPVGLLVLAGQLLGRPAAVEALTTSLTIDNDAVCKALGWVPSFSVDEGLAASFAKSANT
ncbi:NAD-dependent epimerase/dehydratase family protein [Pelagibius litoralis]|uniref:NAD-dependent epimerase/dehydratase family protein n=1 Tax=Pelagibius litoralis TaxID=374515 RepID=A0A967C3C4_9PROT|nr:NAD-dependent epimerase/dehydratase family protein [Pelagibius litoralis]NIA69023.1 NAD-dependent epimerase/dehydratase family protein [Pelagibius litoralis]